MLIVMNIFFSLACGIITGTVYFIILWQTVKVFLQRNNSSLLIISSFLLRNLMVVLMMLLLVKIGYWWSTIPGLLGFISSRHYFIHRLNPQTQTKLR
ncbi:hypothetical protein GF407_07465 [candidate division KSB1 bacterium]|nr:hypothetical protein [candidate division KSB1 bacterium]